jgi:sigma-B regulation protein RsbU (phosphoserine phosphatase)
MRKSHGYAALAALFVVAVACQVRFSADAVKDLTHRDPRAPFILDAPWPTARLLRPEARAAGLEEGDRVLAVDGRKPAGIADLMGAVRRKAPGGVISVEVSRNGATASLQIRLVPTRDRTSAFVYAFAAVVWFALPVLSLALGFWVALIRPTDSRAWMLLGLLLGFVQFLVDAGGRLDPHGWPAFLRLPALLYTNLAGATWPIWMMLFGLYFPARWKFDRRAPWVKWVLIVPLALQAILRVAWAVGRAESFSALAFLEPAVWRANLAAGLLWIPALSLFFIGLQSKMRDPATEPDSRRRLVLLHAGSMWSFLPLTLLCSWALIAGRWPLPEGPALMFALLWLFGFPLTMAYVIVVERALDVKVVIRTGVQYALAQGTVRTLQVLLSAAAGVLAVLLALDPNTNRPGKLTLIAAGVAAVVLVRRFSGSARSWIDRKFFREAYQADQILSELSEDVRSVTDTERLLEMVARRISESLHVERVAVLLRSGDVYAPALALGYWRTPEVRFAAGAAVAADLERAAAPLPVYLNDEDSWARAERVSERERGELADLESQLLLPLPGKDGLLGFLSLGPKRSEAPYSKTDARLLRSVAAQTGLALENARLIAAVAAETVKREVLNREMEIAREVQQRLFPQTLPAIEGLEYAGACRPALGVGGDYYDFLALGGGRLGVAIGDVSGKGMPAALLMASLQASVRGQAQSGTVSLARLMEIVNRLVFDASAENRYATFFYAEYDAGARRLRYVNAGHNPPMLLRGAEVVRLETGGPVVGIFRDACYQEGDLPLEAGDALVLFTDGISEAMNPAYDEWGEEALAQAARESLSLSATGAIEHIMRAADSFAAGAPQHDDMTLVVMRVA